MNYLLKQETLIQNLSLGYFWGIGIALMGKKFLKIKNININKKYKG